MKINEDIVNDVIYKYAKFYYKILCIVGYTKITKSSKIYRFKVYILRPRRLSFLCSLKYIILKKDFLHAGGINCWIHANIFFHTFLKLRNIIFTFFLK
jgi:hypothetical protein